MTALPQGELPQGDMAGGTWSGYLLVVELPEGVATTDATSRLQPYLPAVQGTP